MVAILDIPVESNLTIEQAEYWIAATLAEAKALRQHDAELFPKDAPELARARTLHAAWARWADAADAMYDRVKRMKSGGRYVNGLSDLDFAIGRTRAMLTVTPESCLEPSSGRTYSMEEVRRELRDRIERTRNAGVSVASNSAAGTGD